MLPSPSCSFNIPSFHDSLQLDCRLYFPKQSSNNDDRPISGFSVVAHPYAPLGGCYDDPTVNTLGASLLRQNLVLCTFNFRGAIGSQGRTSWSGRPELADYVSVYVFMLHLISYTNVVDHVSLIEDKPLLILGGYSYGSMIASHLPPFVAIRSFYGTSQIDELDHNIKLRAQEIGKVLVNFLQSRPTQNSDTRRIENDKSPSSSKREVMMGGHDLNSTNPRASRESFRHSRDAKQIRRSIERLRHKLIQEDDHINNHQDLERHLPSESGGAFAIEPSIAYLLVSPLLQPVAGFTTAFSRLVFEPRNSVGTPKIRQSMEQNLAENPTLVVYGDKDIFTSARRLRRWIDEFQSNPGVRLTSKEVAGAGHFWHQEQLQVQLRTSVRNWVESLNDSFEYRPTTYTKGQR